jgi:hypothetical protein
MEINESLILTKTAAGELSPSLTSQEARIVLSSRGTKIKDLKKKEVANKVTDLFGASLVVLNHPNKIGKEDRLAMEQVIVNDLYEKFAGYTLKEVENAFWMGSRGQLKAKPEDVVYMSIAQVYQWLISYRIVIKRDALKKQLDFEAKHEEKVKEGKIKEMEELMRKTIIASWNDFKEGGEIIDPVGHIYDWLDKRGHIKLSKDRKKEIYAEAQEALKDRVKQRNGKIKASSVGEYFENKKIIEALEGQSIPSQVQSQIKIVAKHKALTITFKDIIESGLTMEEYLSTEESI